MYQWLVLYTVLNTSIAHTTIEKHDTEKFKRRNKAECYYDYLKFVQQCDREEGDSSLINIKFDSIPK